MPMQKSDEVMRYQLHVKATDLHEYLRILLQEFESAVHELENQFIFQPEKTSE